LKYAGIWQFGSLPEDAQDALAKTGWIEKDENQEQTTPLFVDFGRQDIEGIVQGAVSEETFADERSKQVFLFRFKLFNFELIHNGWNHF
jgi:hypothetical protein